MGKTITTKIDDGRMLFTFTDPEGEVISSFRMNPTDVHLAKRCGEVSKRFQEREAPENATMEEAAAYDTWIEEQFNYLLGYDASRTMFDQLTATTLLPDGRMFALLVMDRILEEVEPEIRKRNQKMAKVMDQYTEKYK